MTILRVFRHLACIVLTGSLLLLVNGPAARAAEVEVKATLGAASDVSVAIPGKGVRFPDGSVQTTARPGFKRTVAVYGLEEPGRNGAALLAALAAISDASAGNPWLLKIEPGVYDLGNNSLQMKAWVDIEGAGEAVTRIKGNVDHATRGVVCGAPDATLRLLTVENTGGGATAIALSTFDIETAMLHVRATASGATTNIGMFNDQSPHLRLSHLTVEAHGGTTAYGIKNTATAAIISDLTAIADGAATTCAVCNSSSETLMRGINANASGGTTNTAISNDFSYARMDRATAAAAGGNRAVAVFSDNFSMVLMNDMAATATLGTETNTAVETRQSSAIMRRVQCEATGAGTCHGILNTGGSAVELYHLDVLAAEGAAVYAIRNEDTSLSMVGVRARAAAAAPSSAYGLYILGESYEVLADSCAFSGSSYSVHNSIGVTVSLGACRLEGPVNEVELYRCAECFDETAFPLDDVCQASPL